MTLEKQETELELSVDIHQKPDARLVYNLSLPHTLLSHVSVKEGERDGQRQKRRT